MPSQRTHPPKSCQNPQCDKEFIPTDKRQVYCSRRCQINYNNDKKNWAYAAITSHQKLEQSDLALDFLYTHAGGNQYAVKERILHLQKVDLSIGTLVYDQRRDQQIRWYIHYGLIRIHAKEQDYFIVSRQEMQP